MTIRQQYKDFIEQLTCIYSQNESTILTDWVFESSANILKADLIKTPDLVLPDNVFNTVQQQLQQLLLHQPIQYVLGEAWFYALKLKVNNQVLIPRPETEELVNLVLAKKYASPPSILDIGTGSGCIPIAIKKNLPDCTISGIDISDGALRIALENSILHGTNISFIQADITDESGWHQFPQYDCVISNPPYIPLSEKALMDTNVTAYEPATALFVTDKDPFLFYRKIALFGKQHLNPGGMIFFETHENYAGEVATILSQDYKEVCIFKDVFGKERMVTAILYH